MTINPIGVAVPVFFLLMAVEFFFSWRQKRQIYRLNDTLVDLGCGVGEQIIGLFAKLFKIAIFTFVSETFGLLNWSTDTALTWIVGFIGVDFFYYWYHRFSHRVNFAWATHVVHHQSEDYNFAVALRQPWFTQFYSWIFYLPLALLGIPAMVYVISFSFNLLYQFLLHTRLVSTLGPCEWLMNTPSHHRVHHGVEEKYLDKNYGGVLIVWDRIFGTFEPEEEEPTYGILKPLPTWNPLWANVQPFVALAKRAWNTHGLLNKLWMWFAPPAWEPGKGEVIPAFPPQGRDYDRDNKAMHSYLLFQLFPLVAVMTWLLLFEKDIDLALKISLALFLILTMVSWSALVEGRSWGPLSESSRLVLLLVYGGLAYYLVPTTMFACLALVSFLLSAGSLVWLKRSWVAIVD